MKRVRLKPKNSPPQTFEHRGIKYQVWKGPAVDSDGDPYPWSQRYHKVTSWHARVDGPSGTFKIRNKDTRREAVEQANEAINVILDFNSDPELANNVRRVLLMVGGFSTPFLDSMGYEPPALQEQLRELDKIYEHTKLALKRQEGANKNKVLIAKLRRMTVANGCTPGEAASAAAKLAELEGRPHKAG